MAAEAGRGDPKRHAVVGGESGRVAPSASRDPGQLALFSEASAPDPMVEELRSIDVNSLTPLEALNRLADFQRRVGERK